MAVLPLIEQEAKRRSRLNKRYRKAQWYRRKYDTTIDKAWTIMLLDDLRRQQDAAAAKRKREAHYKAWQAWVDKMRHTQEGLRELARHVHWSDVIWSGDRIAWVYIEYPGYRGD